MATFDARESVKKLESFTFVDLDGEEHELPHMKSVKSALVQRLQAGDEDALREIAGEDAFEALQEMPAGVGEDLSNAWAEHSGASGKERSPSSPTKKPSKPRKRT